MYICLLIEELFKHGSEEDLIRLCIKGAWRFNTSLKLDSHFFQARLGSLVQLVDSISCQGIFCRSLIKSASLKCFKLRTSLLICLRVGIVNLRTCKHRLNCQSDKPMWATPDPAIFLVSFVNIKSIWMAEVFVTRVGFRINCSS